MVMAPVLLGGGPFPPPSPTPRAVGLAPKEVSGTRGLAITPLGFRAGAWRSSFRPPLGSCPGDCAPLCVHLGCSSLRTGRGGGYPFGQRCRFASEEGAGMRQEKHLLAQGCTLRPSLLSQSASKIKNTSLVSFFGRSVREAVMNSHFL